MNNATHPNAPRRLSRLDRERRKHGITLAVIAAEAAKTSRRGTVAVPTVSHVLAGRYKNANVVATLRRLIADAKAGPGLVRDPQAAERLVADAKAKAQPHAEQGAA